MVEYVELIVEVTDEWGSNIIATGVGIGNYYALL
jgi:hypothetical protein